MILAMGLLNLLAGVCIAYSTGANDAANAMGTAVGAGVRTVRQATLLVAVFGLLGVLLQGRAIATTVGNTIIRLDGISAGDAEAIVLAAYLSAGSWVTLTTYLGLPTSTSHSLTGAMAGAGLASHLAPIYWSKLAVVVTAWIVTPMASGILAYVAGSAMHRLRGRERHLAHLWTWLLTLSGAYMAYSWGAAGIANVAGPLVHNALVGGAGALVLGGLAATAGVILWGNRVMSTVGNEITSLVPSMAFASEVSSAAVVHLCAILGIPVSSSHAIVGGIVGVGLCRRRKGNELGLRVLTKIISAWAATPLVCFVVAYALYIAVASVT